MFVHFVWSFSKFSENTWNMMENKTEFITTRLNIQSSSLGTNRVVGTIRLREYWYDKAARFECQPCSCSIYLQLLFYHLNVAAKHKKTLTGPPLTGPQKPDHVILVTFKNLLWFFVWYRWKKVGINQNIEYQFHLAML